MAFIAAVQTTDQRHAKYACFSRQPFTSSAAAVFAAESLATTANVVSDGPWGFGVVKLIGAEQVRIVTGDGPGSAELPQFKAINSVLGDPNTALSGTDHAFDFAKFAHRYLAESQCRFNRRFDLATILARLLRAASLTPPRPTPRIRLAEDRR